jgi:hypothetical protein
LLFTIGGSYAVGEVYRATVVVTNDDRTMLRGRPRYTGEGRLDADHTARLRAEHYAAQTRLSLATMERAAGKRDELLEPLRAVARTLRTRADATAFIAYVLRELSAPDGAPTPRREARK